MRETLWIETLMYVQSCSYTKFALTQDSFNWNPVNSRTFIFQNLYLKETSLDKKLILMMMDSLYLLLIIASSRSSASSYFSCRWDKCKIDSWMDRWIKMILLLTSLTDVSSSVVTVKMVLVGYVLVIDAVVARGTTYVLSNARNSYFKFRRWWVMMIKPVVLSI